MKFIHLSDLHFHRKKKDNAEATKMLRFIKEKYAYRDLKKFFQDPDNIYIFHPQSITGFKFRKMRTIFNKALRKYGYEAFKVKSFSDVKGREIYSLFEARLLPESK